MCYNKPMKIAFFSDCYLDLTGGIVTTITAQKKELEKRGHTVYVFSSSYKKSPTETAKLAKNHIFPVKSCRFFGRGATPIARRPRIVEKQILREHPEIKDFDIFYIHYEAGCSIAGLRLGKNLKVKTIQVMHGREDIGIEGHIPRGLRTIVATCLNWFHSWYLPHPVKIKRDAYLASTIAAAKMWSLMVNHANSADLVLTPSKHFQQKLLHYGVKKPLKVLPNGVEDELFDSTITPRSITPGEPLRMIWHSRIYREKRLLPFLESLRLLEQSALGLSDYSGKKVYCLDVYGGGDDYNRAQRFIKKHRLNVVLHGDTPFYKIYPAIKIAHLDILNSYNYDTFGMTLIEAESAGTPVLFVDPDLKETVPAAGAVFVQSDIENSPPSPDKVAETLKGLITSPDNIKKMSEVMLKNRDNSRVSKIVDKLEKYIRIES